MMTRFVWGGEPHACGKLRLCVSRSDPSLHREYFFLDSILAKFWMFDPANPLGTVDNIHADLGSANPYPAADGNANAFLDAAGYVVWCKNNCASVHAGAGRGSNSAVPEPEAILHASLSMVTLQLLSTTRLLGALFAAGVRDGGCR
jgi:hypothetical protein